MPTCSIQTLSNSYTPWLVRLLRGDNPRALASGLS